MPKLNISDVCSSVRAPASSSILNYALSLGLPLSCLPQCHRILSRGSSYGISPSFIALSTAYSSSAFANVLLLTSADGAVDCCQYNGFHGSNCFAALTSIWQHGLLWLGATIVLVVYLVFYTNQPPRRASLTGSTTSSEQSMRDDDDQGDKLLPRAPKVVGAACVIPVLLILVPSSVIASSPSTKAAISYMVLSFWTVFVSGISFILGAVQFIPQMRMTLRLKHSGSLSIPTMCVQIPLLFIHSASLASRVEDLLAPGTTDSVKFASAIAWINHILVGCLETLMLVLAAYMNHIRPRLRKSQDGEGRDIVAVTPPNEETPLIEGEDVDEQRLSRVINKTLSGSRY